MAKQQTAPKPPADPVAAAEQTIADLEAQREKIVTERLKDDEEMRRVSFQAHALHEVGASRTLSEITGRAIERDQRLRSLDLAIAEAGERLGAAKAAEARAENQARAEEARELACELGKVFPYLDRKLEEAANALIAINNGVAQLHAAGFQFPSDNQLRLNICAIIETWAMRLPKQFHNQLRDGVRFLAPHERKTAVEYWAQLHAGIDNQISQRLGEAERTNTEAA
jgi:hypothetical protein